MGAAERYDFQTSGAAGTSGSDRAFSAALVEATTLLKGRAMMLAGDGPLSDDFVQATFERALRATHRPPPLEVRPWLARILRNVAIDHWRTAAVRHSCELDPETTPAPTTSEEPRWWHEVDADAVARAARQLPGTFRRLFLLRLEGLSNNDIARRLGLKPSTVATRFFRGRALMQRALADACAPQVP